MRTYYVYLLECYDGLFYIGVTNDLDRRLMEHQKGFYPNCFTYERRPVTLKHYVTFDYIDEAIYYEKKLKKYSRAKK
jgi:putative endonuclease